MRTIKITVEICIPAQVELTLEIPEDAVDQESLFDNFDIIGTETSPLRTDVTSIVEAIDDDTYDAIVAQAGQALGFEKPQT